MTRSRPVEAAAFDALAFDEAVDEAASLVGMV
jgi:hypothetical protein